MKIEVRGGWIIKPILIYRIMNKVKPVIEYLSSSKKYKYVSSYLQNGEVRYYGRIKKLKQKKLGFKTEIEAARWVDIQLIRANLEPVNIFKPKFRTNGRR